MRHKNNNLVFLDGVFLLAEQVGIPSLITKGVCCSLRIDNGVVESFETHLRVFDTHCNQFSMYSPFVMENWVSDLIHCNDAETGIWELCLYAIEGDKCKEGNSFRFFSHFLMTTQKSGELSRSPLTLGVKTISFSEPCARIRSIENEERRNLFLESREEGVDNFLFTNASGEILDASFSNIFWFHNGIVYTPDPEQPLIFGVSLMTILCAVETSLGMEVIYVKGKVSEIPCDANVFLCDSINHFQPVKTIQERSFQRDLDFEENLSNAYEKLVLEFSLDCR
jgi:hypothetical protein